MAFDPEDLLVPEGQLNEKWFAGWDHDMSRDITEIRAYLRLQNRDQTWAYVEKKKKEQYIRIAVKKLGEEYDDFHEMKPFDQLELIVARAKFLAIKEANSDNEFEIGRASCRERV